MNVPKKVKHFVWKVCKNILATKENLWRRNITKDNTCEVCKKQVESIGHLFWFYDHVKEVWYSCKLSLSFEIHPSRDYMNVIWHLQKWEESRPRLLEWMVKISWGIWKDRNDIRHRGRLWSGQAVTRSLLCSLEEFQLANERLMANAKRNHVVKWALPQAGCYKVNVDRVVFSKKKQSGVGVVVKDGAIQVIATLSKKQYSSLGPLEIEAKAMEIGVTFAMKVGVGDVTFEGDSLEICNAIHGLTIVAPSVQNVVTGILKCA
ncbi:hypothetical protein CFP56_001159 [Quercus suber]|uniref:Reverse transcriptase zinc-binding domain-containing protein n=1 Tax=Quercus suber TaxID=58331 RepID=A0AAW0LFP2_QUESU